MMILVHNPVGFGTALVKHQNPFLTYLFAVTSLSLDRIGNARFLPKTGLGFPLLSLTFLVFAFLASEEIPNLVTRLDPRLRCEVTKRYENQKLVSGRSKRDRDSGGETYEVNPKDRSYKY